MRTVLVSCLLAAGAAGAAHAGQDLERGAYLAQIMDCAGCHSGRTPDGALDPNQHLSGGTVGFEMSGTGVFWPPNLTPDPTGLGDWSEAEITTALRTGVRPDGRQLSPIMPWQSYAALSEDDAAALVAYLKSLPPAANKMPDPTGPGAQAALPFYRVMPPG